VSKQHVNLQDGFLNQVRKENIPVTVYLVNGYQLKGHVKSFDNFTVLLENEGKQQLVYKHALSTIMPMRNINLAALRDDGENQ
jgi:host factor-I protein